MHSAWLLLALHYMTLSLPNMNVFLNFKYPSTVFFLIFLSSLLSNELFSAVEMPSL